MPSRSRCVKKKRGPLFPSFARQLDRALAFLRERPLRDPNNDPHYRNPRAWARARAIFGRDDAGLAMRELERHCRARNACPRRILATAVFAFIAMKPKERQRAFRTYEEFEAILRPPMPPTSAQERSVIYTCRQARRRNSLSVSFLCPVPLIDQIKAAVARQRQNTLAVPLSQSQWILRACVRDLEHSIRARRTRRRKPKATQPGQPDR